MKAKVHKDECIGCGACVNICPQVFRLDENEKAEVYVDISKSDESCTVEAAHACPVVAIEIEK